jgi:hypothetical protein
LTTTTVGFIIDIEREVRNMTSYYYQFADGYFCWVAGRLSKADKACEIRKHGAIVLEKRM